MNIYAMKKPKRINAVSVSLFVFAVLFVYGVWALVPTFWPLWQMSGIMRSGCARAYQSDDNEWVMKQVLKDSRRTGLTVTKNNFRLARVPYDDAELEGKTKAMQDLMVKYGRECVLRFRYVDTYQLPLIGVEYRLPYESKITVNLRRNEGDKNTLNDLVYNSCSCTSVRRPSKAREAR